MYGLSFAETMHDHVFRDSRQKRVPDGWRSILTSPLPKWKKIEEIRKIVHEADI